MSDQPKVSERMFNLVECAVAAAHSWPKPICIADVPSEEIINGYYLKMLLSAIAEIEQRAEKADALYDCGTSSCLCGGLLEPLHGGQHTNGPCQCTPMQLRQAVYVARQRAERWKEVGVALYQCSREIADIGCKDFALTNNRLDAAIAALGDEWDEAKGANGGR